MQKADRWPVSVNVIAEEAIVGYRLRIKD